ncbi:L,D-transpeptidase family protein [Vulcaniibacterium gelatinicum]|uniref:L,D-transpeptidase family protein n=1 Tax=Vulcaniibacterium gelatinicum TaxID=2598725 RepID=UPI0015F2B1F4|nr:L,D-transpeptidase family protein [Vulcaniibacterium gelatinicum]
MPVTPARRAWRWCCAALLLAALCGAMAAPPPPEPALPAGGYVWTPEFSPQGPVLIVIGLAEQRAYVYRNGVRIGASAVSTGRPGYETPTGVFSILEKRREHYSNLYDDAPMPFMQRLTWDGLALHAGALPGRPASHGCVRLPYGFAERLFGITSRGMTVAIVDRIATPTVVSPGLFATAAAAPPAGTAFTWTPERSPQGPLAIVLSTRDREVVVLRNAVEIGRAPVTLEDGALTQPRAYVLLAGPAPGTSAMFPDRPALRWLELSFGDGPRAAGDGLHEAVARGHLRVDGAFARVVYDALVPGTTLLVTDEPIRAVATSKLTVLEADVPPEPQD